MTRWRLTIEYDGRPFMGWQRQDHGPSVQQALEEGLKFARCMRSHGVTNWPDPSVDSLGRPSFQVTKAGISIDATRSPQMLSKIGECQSEPHAVLLRQE